MLWPIRGRCRGPSPDSAGKRLIVSRSRKGVGIDAAKNEEAKRCVDAAVAIGEATEKHARLGIATLLLLFFGLILPSQSAEQYLADWARIQERVDAKTQKRDDLRDQNKTRQLRSQAAIKRLNELEKIRRFRAGFLATQEAAGSSHRPTALDSSFQTEYGKRTDLIAARYPESKTALAALQLMDRDELAQERKRLEQKAESAGKRYEEQKRAIQEEIAGLVAQQKAQSTDAVVPLKVLGAFDLNLGPDQIKVPILGLPVVWSLLFCLLLFYLSQMRRVMLSMYANAVRILSPHEATVAKLAGPLASRFWWLAPLPKISDGAGAPQDLRVALGWSDRHEQVPLACVLCALAMGVFQGAVVAATFGRIGIVESGAVRHIVPFVVCSAAALTCFIVQHWLSGGRVPNSQTRGPDDSTRRQALHLAAMVLVAGILAAAVPSDAPLRTRSRTLEEEDGEREARYRRRSKRLMVATVLPTGFYLNPWTNIIHHSSPIAFPPDNVRDTKRVHTVRQQPGRRGHAAPPHSTRKVTKPPGQCRAKGRGNAFRHTDGLPLQLMVPVDLAYAASSRVNRLGASLAFEFEALRLVGRNDGEPPFESIPPCADGVRECRIDAAISLLAGGIRDGGLRSLRVYDLLALLAARYQRQLALDQLVAAVRSSSPEAAFESRLRAWTLPTSGFWRRARQNKLQWAGVELYET
jgi:hypothetical protein